MSKHFPNYISEFKQAISALETVEQVIEYKTEKSQFEQEQIKRPQLKHIQSPTKDQFEAYQKELADYELKAKLKNERNNEFLKIRHEMKSLVRERLRELAGFYKIPRKYQKRLLHYMGLNIVTFNEYQYYDEIQQLVKIFK